MSYRRKNIEASHIEIRISTLNHKLHTVFYSLNNYNSHIMQELSKFDLKINVMPNEQDKYLSFNINDKLIFIDSFRFLVFPLDSLLKNLSKDDLIIWVENSMVTYLIYLSRKDIILMSISMILKGLKKNCQTKIRLQFFDQ